LNLQIILVALNAYMMSKKGNKYRQATHQHAAKRMKMEPSLQKTQKEACW